MEFMKSESKTTINRNEKNSSSSSNQKVDASWLRLIFIALKKEKLPAETIFFEAGIDVEGLKEQEFTHQGKILKLYQVIEKYDALPQLPSLVADVFQSHFIRHTGNILFEAKTIEDLINKIVYVVSKVTHLISADISEDSRFTKLNISSTVSTYSLHPISLITCTCLVVKAINQIFPYSSKAIVNVILSKESKQVTLSDNFFSCPIIYSTNNTYAVVFERTLLNTENIFSSQVLNESRIAFSNKSKSDLNIFSEVQQLILKNISDPELSIFQISQTMNMGVKTLQRLLKRFETSFSEMVLSVKIKLALFHLKENKLSMQQISFELGFLSPSSFSRAFKKWTGKAPSQFQQK